MTRLKQFSQYSGCKLNIQKTQTLTYIYVPKENIRKMHNFKWNTNKLTYLEVTTTKALTEIYNLNYNAITQNIKVDSGRWAPLTVCLYGRIEIVTIFSSQFCPVCCFFFSPCQLKFPRNNLMSGKEWSHNLFGEIKTRVQLETLQLPKDQGRLSLPNLEDNYDYSFSTWLDFVILDTKQNEKILNLPN